MSIHQLTNVLVTVTLIEMMAATGLGVTFGDLARVARDWRLVVRAVLANYVLVPAATVGLLLLFGAQPMVAAGFLILAVCPGAPYGPPFAAIAKGNVPVAVGLMLLLAASSALLAPVLLHLLLPLVAGDEPLSVGAAAVLGTLLVTQLIPLCVGMAVRQWLPAVARRLQGPANLVSKGLNLVVVGFILAAQFHLFLEIRPRAYVGMFALLLLSWAAGWLLGGSSAAHRRTMTLTTSLRNVGVGLVIATGTFAGTAAVAAALVYGLFEVVGSLLLALVWARRRAANGVTAGAPASLLEPLSK
jgi:BASS family bile acid:Na+ symporter